MSKKNKWPVASVFFLALSLPALAFSENSTAFDQVVNQFLKPLGLDAPAKAKHDLLSTQELICISDDFTVSQMENGILLKARQAMIQRDPSALARLGIQQVAGLQMRAKPARSMDGIVETKWDAGKKMTSLGDYLAAFAQIDYVEMKPIDYAIDPAFRDEAGHFSQINLTLRYDLRGRGMDGKLRNDRGLLRMAMKKAEADWGVTGVSALSGETVVQSRAPAFTEVTQASGLAGAKTYLRREAIRRGGYALSVADVNGDGKQDIFVGSSGSPELWLGNGDGTFTRTENNPFKSEHHTKTAVFFDSLNHGQQDAIINRYISRSKMDNSVDVVLYKNQGNGHYLTQELNFGNKALREPMPAAVADFDGDGYLDFYIGYPGKQDFSYMGQQDSRPLNEVQGLYLNDGKGFFRDFTEQGIRWNVQGEYQGHLFPHSSMAFDINQDGNQDLIVADDRGNLSPLFVNEGHGKFRERSSDYGIVNNGYSMSIAAGDIKNSGRAALAITNVHLTEFDRLNKTCRAHFGREGMGFAKSLSKGLRVFEPGAKGNAYTELGPEALSFPGEGVAGLTFVDYNNDGLLDLYVTNGLWSGTKDGQETGSLFSAIISLKQSFQHSLDQRDQIHFMDVLSEVKGRIRNYWNSRSVQPGGERLSLGGHQRNRLYRNNGDGTFTEVAFLEGVDSEADGYIVAKANLTQDGRVDLILRNADPGTDENRFPVVQVYKNRYAGQNHSAIFTFQGTKSNRDAFGLYAKAFLGKTKHVEYLVANSGSVQEQRMLHFGMGAREKIDRLEIHWPSGLVQNIKDIKPGYHHVVEPALGVKLGSEKTKGRKLSFFSGDPQK